MLSCLLPCPPCLDSPPAAPAETRSSHFDARLQLPAVIDAQRTTAARKAAEARPAEGKAPATASPAAASSSAALSAAMVAADATLSAAAPPLLPQYKTTLQYKTTFVVTPAISLMCDQVMQINGSLTRHTSDLGDLGVSPGGDFAAFLGMGQEDKAVAEAAKDGKYRLVFLTEQLLFGDPQQTWIGNLKRLHAEGRLLLIAIDEAHCVVQYPESGSFRTHYRELGKLRTALPAVPMMALSAVPTSAMWARIENSLGVRTDAVRTIGSVYRCAVVLVESAAAVAPELLLLSPSCCFLLRSPRLHGCLLGSRLICVRREPWSTPDALQAPMQARRAVCQACASVKRLLEPWRYSGDMRLHGRSQRQPAAERSLQGARGSHD